MMGLAGVAPSELSKRTRILEQEGQKDEGNLSDVKFTLGCCFLKMHLYDKALKNFEDAIDGNVENSEIYFYAAVAMLKGKRPFLTTMAILRKMQEYIEAALLIDENPIYRVFLSYIKLDFYGRKHLRISPDWEDEYQSAMEIGCNQNDVDDLFELLGQDCPDEFCE